MNILSIIILTWNGLELTKNCVNSIIATVKTIPLELIFVDNGSTDGTLDYFKELLSTKQPENIKNITWMTRDKTKESWGFASACNKGMSKCNGDIAIICNNDIICIPGTIYYLYSSMNLFTNFDILASTTDTCGQPLQYFPNHNCVKPTVIPSDDVNFICVAIRKSFWDNVKLDEHYISGVEDIDYCWEAHRRNRDVGVCLASFVYHIGSVTNKREYGNKKMNENLYRGWLYFASKWGERGRVRAGDIIK